MQTLIEVDSTASYHRPFVNVSKHITVSLRWLNTVINAFNDHLVECDRLLLLRIDLRYGKHIDESYIPDDNSDIRDFICQLKEEVGVGFKGIHAFREFGQQNGKKHYHCLLYFDGYKHKSIGSLFSERSDTLVGKIRYVGETVFGDCNPQINHHELVHREKIDIFEQKRIEEDYFHYLCKLETKYNDGIDNCITRKFGEKKKGDVTASPSKSLESNLTLQKKNPMKLQSASYNVPSVKSDYSKVDYRNLLHLYHKGCEGYSKNLLVGLQLFAPDGVVKDYHRTHIDVFHTALSAMLKEEGVGYTGLISRYHQQENAFNTILFLSGHNRKVFCYRKDYQLSLLSLTELIWQNECVSTGRVSVFKSIALLNKHRYDRRTHLKIAESFILPLAMNPERHRIINKLR